VAKKDPDKPPRYPVTLSTKRKLRRAADRQGKGTTHLGQKAGVTHAAVAQMLSETSNTWTSEALPAVAADLGYKLYEVLPGFSTEQVRILKALDLMAEYAPERVEGWLVDVQQRAADITGRPVVADHDDEKEHANATKTLGNRRFESITDKST
jgi:hypothetical protein